MGDGIRIAYAPNKVETAELLSKMAGVSTRITNHITSGVNALFSSKNATQNQQATSRPLLTTDECMTLKSAKKAPDGTILEPGDMLIFMAGRQPIMGKQLLFFLSPTLNARSKVAPPIISDVTRYDEKDAHTRQTTINDDTKELEQSVAIKKRISLSQVKGVSF